MQVAVTNGNPPARVVDMSENEESIPFMIGKIFYDKGDGTNIPNAAEVCYSMEGDDITTLTWPMAVWPAGAEAGTSTDYHVLCYEEDHLAVEMSNLQLRGKSL